MTVCLRHYTLKEDDIRVLELAHDGGLRQEVHPRLVGRAGLQRLDGHQHVGAAGDGAVRQAESASAHVAELSTSDDGLDGDEP